MPGCDDGQSCSRSLNACGCSMQKARSKFCVVMGTGFTRPYLALLGHVTLGTANLRVLSAQCSSSIKL